MDKDKQTTETYAVKLDPGVKEELQELIKENDTGGTQGDFIRLLVETFKTNKLNNNIVDNKSDLRELNTLTTRMYSLYSNLIDKNNSTIEGIKADVDDKIQIKEDELYNLKNKIMGLKEVNGLKIEEVTEISEQNKKLSEENNQLIGRASKDSMLIEKLNEEVEEVKELRADSKTMKVKYKEIEDMLTFMTTTNKELQSTIESNETMIGSLTTKLEEKELEYEEELEEKKSKYKENVDGKKIENEREIDNLKHSLKSKNVEEILKLKEEHQTEVKELQDKSFEDKEKLQDKYNERLDKVDQEKEALQKEIQVLKNQLNSK